MRNLKNKKVAIYGGSFNPIHIGHLLTGLEVVEKLGYDYILFIPDNIPVHKDFAGAAAAADRLNMVALAVKGIKRFFVSDVEIRRGGKSFTIDTVLELKKKISEDEKFGIIFGADLVHTLPSWKGIEQLQEYADFICLKRGNEKIPDSIYKLHHLENRTIDVSSTEIRKRISGNMPIDYMVTENVKKYIMKNNLYRNEACHRI